MENLAGILVPIACGCVLPIMMIWLHIRRKMHETNTRTRIVLAAIEKNPEMDIEELLDKMTPKRQLLKEKLLSKLLWGSLCTLSGTGLTVFGIIWLCFIGGTDTDEPTGCIYTGLLLLGIGIAFLINYVVGKKMLAKEMEAEEKKLTAQA